MFTQPDNANVPMVCRESHQERHSHGSVTNNNNNNISSTSASEMSEAVSDMSLSTSPGSDAPRAILTSSKAKGAPPQQAPVRKRVVVRQLSSNPYLASSEMSPSEDHPAIMGSHSYAAGESRHYLNGDHNEDNVQHKYMDNSFQLRANSFPLASDVIGESEDTDELSAQDSAFPLREMSLSKNAQDNNSKLVDPPDKPVEVNMPTTERIFSSSAQASHQSNSVVDLNENSQQKTHSKQRHQQKHHHHSGSHTSHHSNTHHTRHHSSSSPSHPSSQQLPPHSQRHPSDPTPHSLNQYSNTNGNLNNPTTTVTSCEPNSFATTVNTHSNENINASNSSSAKHSTSKRSDKRVSGQPPSSAINTWGHFSRPSDGNYKYRRSHYTSDSDDEEDVRGRRGRGMPGSSRFSSSRGHSSSSKHTPSHHTPNGPHSPSMSPCVHKKSLSAGVSQAVSGVVVQGSSEGKHHDHSIKPHVFKDRFQVMKRWFSDCNDSQKNIILKGLLSLCELPQLHLLSVHMSREMHNGCPSNCEDLLTWLPQDLATKVMSYLDPVSLCRATQVCRVWRHLAEEQSLWRRFCCQAKWRLSKAAEHKQVISHMSPEGSIQWKNVFAERFRLRNNWLKGRCTVRTFEGHLQGISCVQFDDSRIVSGSSDKTIKVWNMRTNAPWSVQTLMGHHGTVRCLHLEGNRLVSGSCDNSIKVWDLSTQDSWSSIACKVTMAGHTDTVRCLQADDDKVISGSYDKTLKIWDLKSGVLRRTLSGHQASVLCVHFSETKIVSGSADKTIKVWNYDGRCTMTLRGHQDAVTCLMFDSTKIVSGSLDHNLKFWDIHSGDCLNTIDWKKAEGHTDVVRCLQADSWRVVSAADDRTIKVWNLATGERLVTLRNHTDGVTCLQFNDFIIVSGSYDKSVKLWDFSCC